MSDRKWQFPFDQVIPAEVWRAFIEKHASKETVSIDVDADQLNEVLQWRLREHQSRCN